MKLKYLVIFMLVFVLALSACTPAAEEPAAEEPAAVDDPCADDEWGCAVIETGQTIKIGMSSPMTGAYADFGIDAENSGLIAVADAGDVEGFTFELVAEDDEGGAEGGAAVANKLVADPTFVAMAGPLFSGATAASMPIYEAAGIPMMSPSATAGFLTQEGSQVFNRLPFVDPIQGAAAADFIFNELGVRSIAVLHDGEDYGRGLATIVKEEFEALGGTVTAFEGITPGEADYTPILSTVATQSPEVVYFGGYNQEGAVITNQMKAVGLEDTIFFGCDGTWGADYLAQTGENGEGSIHANTRAPEESETKAAFDEAYTAAYGVAPVVLSPFSYNSYDAVTILANAVKSVAFLGEDGNLYIPRGALVAEVRGTTGFVGVGTYSCDEIGECNTEGPAFEQVIDGEWVVIQ
jgi:branched-chain amino acid transport system substrate-binding protein